MSAIAKRLNAGRQDIEEFFTEDFVLHQPGAAALPTGHAGARAMAEGFLGVTLAILDMVEEDDRVAVRWTFSGARDGAAI